jgi:hypothetical protein
MWESFSQITNTALDEALGGHVSSPTMEIVKSSWMRFFKKKTTGTKTV